MAGLKKWMPQTWSGRCVAIASSTTGSVDVFVARMRRRLDDLVELGEQLTLRGEVLDDALDDEVARRQFAEVVGDGDPPRTSSPSLASSVSLATCRRRLAATVPTTASAPVRVRDRTTTWYPDLATTSTSPAPITPEPTMPTMSISAMRTSLVTHR